MLRGCPEFTTARGLSRRCLLQAGTAGIAGLGLPALLRAEATPNSRARAKQIILLHQFGGPSHLDTFDMKPGAPEGIRGEFHPIATGQPGLSVSEHLPRFATVIDRFAQIRSVNHRMKNHNSATYYSLTGHAPPVDDIRLRDTQELYPAYGSTVARLRPADDRAVPSFVSYPHVLRDGSVTPGQHASFLGKAFDPFFLARDPNRADFRLPELSLPSTLPLARLEDRRRLQQVIDAQNEMWPKWYDVARGIDDFHVRALTMLESPKVKQAFDLSSEPDQLRDRYGRTTYGQSCLLARRLVESGVRFVSVYFSSSIGGANGGWDTHGDNFNQLKKRLLPITDLAVPTLIQDLDARGLLDETLVVWMGEFGRTPQVQNTKQFGPDGRGHWPDCYTVLMAGGGVIPGAIYGASDRIGAYPASDPVSPDDVAATMYWALGIDPAAEVRDTLGRPLPIAAGAPVSRIFA
jgi:Protein of unknown function (DUF1501)